MVKKLACPPGFFHHSQGCKRPLVLQQRLTEAGCEWVWVLKIICRVIDYSQTWKRISSDIKTGDTPGYTSRETKSTPFLSHSLCSIDSTSTDGAAEKDKRFVTFLCLCQVFILSFSFGLCATAGEKTQKTFYRFVIPWLQKHFLLLKRVHSSLKQ